MDMDEKLIAEPGKKIKIADCSTDYTGDIEDKDEGKKILKEQVKQLKVLQDKLYAFDKYSVLLIFQAMDAAGKDGTIKHVMSGVNPQGCQVYSFKKPSKEELDHDFLWRTSKCLPERGRIGIFNRSYYEEVLITKVHKGIILGQQLPGIDKIEDIPESFYKNRCERINSFEEHLVESGTIVLKFFLNVSKEEQKRRFMERIENPDKNWKFTINDIQERQHWDKYQQAFEDAINATSTKHAPWYVIPADNKWFMRAAVADIVINKLESLNLEYPEVTQEQKDNLSVAKKMLEEE